MNLANILSANKQLKNNVLIIVNGQLKKCNILTNLIKNTKIKIACDGAANFCARHNIVVDYVIGDLDSINKQALNKYNQKIIANKDQDFSDLEKAVNYLISNNYNLAHVFGIYGNRIDHIYYNLLLLTKFKTNIKLYLWNEKHLMILVDKFINLSGLLGAQISFFAFNHSNYETNNATKIKSMGLQYEVNETMPAISLSNKIINLNANIEVIQGQILFFIEVNYF